MLNFEKLNVANDIKSILTQYSIDFVFQPIYSYNKGLIGHEALMRPQNQDILSFIDTLKANGKLHDLELLAFFGATMAYRERGYNTFLCINSFPKECLTNEEALEYSLCFRPIKDKIIIEIMEYAQEGQWSWDMKRQHVEKFAGIEFSLDNFGCDSNDRSAIRSYEPDMVKLDQDLIRDIDKNPKMQKELTEMVNYLHKKAIVVGAKGIESKGEYEFLKSIGLDFYQGYYLGEPC